MASSSTSVTKGTLFATTSLKDQVYDVICIGSGWAARPIAQRAVAAGLTALLIDNELMGGDCPFWACVPSKALLRPIEALHAAGAVAGARQRLTKDTVDVDAVFAHRTAFTRGWDDEKLLVPTIIETGTDLLRGMGRLVGEKKVVVTLNDGHTVELTARHAVAVCTGSVPSIPDVLGLKEAKPWTPREATSSSTVPQHLIVLGAGAVGCEMATAYSGFGAKITLVTAGTEILPKVDKEASELVRKALESRGVRFLLETTLTKAHRTEDKAITVTTSTGEIITASELLVATGRRPQTNGCGLELFGIAVNEAPVDVDESLRVKSVAGNWLYAVGDINGRSPLTHMCKYQGRIAANAIVQQARGGDTSKQTAWNRTSATADHYAVPQVIFTQPAVASTGLREPQRPGLSGP